MSAIESSGTQTATPGTEHILASPAALKTRVLLVDVSALSGTEYVELRVKGPVLFAGTAQLIFIATFYAGIASPHVQLPAVLQPQGGDITLKQVGGSSRAFPWAILTLD